MRGCRLRFAGGEVVDAHAAQGEAFLDEMLDQDDGARRVGEFAFGTNDAHHASSRATRSSTRRSAGPCTSRSARSYPESRRDERPALHWDLVCDLRRGGEVYADGELIYRDGRFLDR